MQLPHRRNLVSLVLIHVNLIASANLEFYTCISCQNQVPTQIFLHVYCVFLK